MNRFSDNVLTTLKSKLFFKFIIVFFIFEASWIALTATYPQAFDENFHFGLVKVYSHYWLPFLSSQPPNAIQYGAVTRDPSYLYHYLLSFPYRLISHYVHTLVAQVILLRFINIALFTSGIVLFRKILIKTKVSEGLTNLILLLFCLIPIVPQLAGQINYDNMLFPLVAIVCLFTFKVIDQIKNKSLSFISVILLISVSLFTSLVKYAFLPIFLAILCFLVFYLFKYQKNNLRKILISLVDDFKKQKFLIKIVLISLLVISLGMFIERDVVNIAKYHAVDPNCSAVLSVNDCYAYSPWAADYSRHQQLNNKLLPNASKNLVYYSANWVYWMWFRLFFAVNGPDRSFTNYPPLPLPSAIAGVIAIVGVIAVFKYRKELFKSNPYAVFLLMVSVFYLLALAVQGYATYQFTAILENMNGRYLLPVLILVIALFGKAFSLGLKNLPTAKVVMTCIVIVMFLQGGGIITFLNRSDDSWDWQNPKVLKINNKARKITKRIVINGNSTYWTSYWYFN